MQPPRLGGTLPVSSPPSSAAHQFSNFASPLVAGGVDPLLFGGEDAVFGTGNHTHMWRGLHPEPSSINAAVPFRTARVDRTTAAAGDAQADRAKPAARLARTGPTAVRAERAAARRRPAPARATSAWAATLAAADAPSRLGLASGGGLARALLGTRGHALLGLLGTPGVAFNAHDLGAVHEAIHQRDHARRVGEHLAPF